MTSVSPLSSQVLWFLVEISSLILSCLSQPLCICSLPAFCRASFTGWALKISRMREDKASSVSCLPCSIGTGVPSGFSVNVALNWVWEREKWQGSLPWVVSSASERSCFERWFQEPPYVEVESRWLLTCVWFLSHQKGSLASQNISFIQAVGAFNSIIGS